MGRVPLALTLLLVFRMLSMFFSWSPLLYVDIILVGTLLFLTGTSLLTCSPGAGCIETRMRSAAGSTVIAAGVKPSSSPSAWISSGLSAVRRSERVRRCLILGWYGLRPWLMETAWRRYSALLKL